ncbi:MAG: 6-phosphofructokinase [Planctomycetota bacterium]
MAGGSTRTLGVLTGGGDCPGLNAVIRAVAGLVEDRWQRLGFGDASDILTRGGTILGTSNRANPFDYTLSGPRGDRSEEAVKVLKRHGVDVLVVIGGDGSLSIAERLSTECGVRVVGVPKTIDNDLRGTDRTFGFDSAVATVAEAIDKIHSTAQSHHRVMIVEVMGRYAGWIALHGGVASGADVILIPEIPYRVERVAEICGERNRRGSRSTIIAIAEGACEEGGTLEVKKIVADSTDPVRLGGVGYRLASQLEGLSDVEIRVTVLGHLQRGGIPTAFDRVLATRFGTSVVEMVRSGEIVRMAALRGDEVTSVPIAEAVAGPKLVERDDPVVLSARGVCVSFGDEPMGTPVRPVEKLD